MVTHRNTAYSGAAVSPYVGVLAVGFAIVFGSIIGSLAAFTGGGTEAEGLRDWAEPLFWRGFVEAGRREDAGLDVRAVDSNRARSPLHAVADDVVAVGADTGGVGVEINQILFLRHRERMVHRVPALGIGVPFDERKVDNPAEAELARITQAAPRPDLVPKSEENVVAHVIGVGDEAEEVSDLPAGSLKDGSQFGFL